MKEDQVPGQPINLQKALTTTLSYREKVRVANKYAETMFDFYFDRLRTPARILKKWEINIGIANGIGEKLMQESIGHDLSPKLKEQGFEIAYEKVLYHDFVSTIIKQMSGNRRNQQLKPYAVDNSEMAHNQFKQERENAIREKLNIDLLEPLREQALQELQKEKPELFKSPNKPGEPIQPQDQAQAQQMQQQQAEQIQQEVQSKVQSRTYDEIFDFLDNTYTLTQVRQADLFLKILIDDLKIKFYTDEAYKMMLPIGREVHYVSSDEKKVTYKMCDPQRFDVLLPKGKIFFSEAIACKYQEEISVHEAMIEFADELSKDDLLSIAMVDGSKESETQKHMDSTLIGILSTENPDSPHRIDLRTQQGQESYYEMIGRDMGVLRMSLGTLSTMLTKTHICWMTTRLQKKITREGEDGEEEIEYADESYTFNPLTDKKWEYVKTPEWWECTRLDGASKKIYLRKRPIPNQYDSRDPFVSECPYIGADYGTYLGNSENISSIDNAKPWILKINVHLAIMHEKEAKNFGMVLALVMKMKPAEYTDAEWFQLLKTQNVLALDPDQEDMVNLQNTPKALNLSNLIDHQHDIGYLDWLKLNLVLGMSHNPNSLGQASPYTSVKNNESNIAMSNLQSADIDVYHDMIVEKICNAIYKHGRIHYSKNKYKRLVQLDDMSRVDLEMDWELQDKANINIRIKTQLDNEKKLDAVRQFLIELARTPGVVTETDMVTVIFSTSYSELKLMARKAEKRRKQIQQDQQAFEERMKKLEQDNLLEMQKSKDQAAITRENIITARDIMVAEEKSKLLQKGYDVDGDKVHDLIKVAETEGQTKIKVKAMEILAAERLQKMKENAEESIKKLDMAIEKYTTDKQASSRNKK